MPEVTLARAPVEPGKADRLRAWFEELHDREPEVVETLRHEGVYTETAFLQSDGDDTYLHVYMEADDLDSAQEAGDEEAYEIDREHHAVLAECLAGEWDHFETIGHFTNPGKR